MPGHLSLNKSIKTISPHLSNNPYSALTTTQRQLDSHRTCPRSIKYSTPGFVKPANPDHLYWCTICDNHSYQHSDGWKKHEKEHETKYVCMLKGLFEATKDGRRCVLCGALDQDDSHHSVHNIAPCIVAVDRPSFKRRYDMVGHLTDAHGISDISKGGIIADTWRCKSSKKAWSCGFCIQLFPSLQNRLKHIGTEHFEKGQSINDWDFTKVILGLLLQRKIQEAWQHLMESLDPFRASETKWNKLGSEDLLYRLERGLTGKETPQTLAKAAYDSAEYDWSPTEDDATVSGITVNTMSNQYTSKGYSPSSQDHTVASAESSMEGQPWSSPQHQAFQIPSSSRISEAQSVYQTAALNPSPAHPLPALDYGPGWKLIASDTDDMSSTRPTTPCNDTFNPAIPSVYTPWSGYNISPDPAHSDQEQFHYKSNDHVDWSAHSFFDTGFDKNGSSLKRPRDSVSPTDHTLPCDNSLKDRPRKKMYRNRSEEDRAASRGFDLKYVQGPMYDDEDTPIYGRANGCLSDDVEK